MSDVWAIFKTKHGALYLEYEFKTGDASKSKVQKKWGTFLETMGTVSIEVRDNNFDQVVLETKKALRL